MSENADPYNDRNKLESNDPANLFDDDFQVDFDEVSERELAGQNQSAVGYPTAHQTQQHIPKSHSAMSEINARNLMTPVDRRLKSRAELPVCFKKQVEVEENQMEIDNLEFSADEDELLALLAPNSSESLEKNSQNFQTQGKIQTHFLGESVNENLRKIENSSVNKSENFEKSSENQKRIGDNSLKKCKKSNEKSENHHSPQNDEIKINEDDLMIISGKETNFEPPISIKSPRQTVNAISPTMDLDEFGDLDWDEFKLEIDTQKPIAASYKPSQTVGNEKKTTNFIIGTPKETAQRPETSIAKSSTACESPSRLAGVGLKSTPRSFATAGSSPLLRPSKSKKASKPEENSKTLFDYFKKTTEHSNAQPKKTDNLSKICDFICEINKKGRDESGGKVIRKKFCIKMTKLQQLTREEAGWLLQGTITDGTGHLDVKFASEVLDKQFGFTAAEFSQKKREGKKNKQLMDELRHTFREAELTLNNLDGIVEVELGGEVPRVVKIEEISETKREDIKKLKRQKGYC